MRKTRIFIVDEWNLRLMIKVIDFHQELFFANDPVSVVLGDENELYPDQVYVMFRASDRRYERIFKNLIKLGYFGIQNGDYYWQKYEAN